MHAFRLESCHVWERADLGIVGTVVGIGNAFLAHNVCMCALFSARMVGIGMFFA
jgi:hypothetical protein